MTASVESAPNDVLGIQRPSLSSIPPAVTTAAGRDAVALARMAGLDLDPWQAYVLEQSLGERGDGLWAAYEVALIVARQNGKGSVLEARELAGLFLFGERLILHSAHEFKTAADAYRRIKGLIQSTPELDRQVARNGYRNAHGNEGIELRDGRSLRFVARTAGSGRGFSTDLVILDEAYNLTDAQMSALQPTLTTSPNPQLWYTSSAVNAEHHANGLVLSRVRRRGLAGDDPALCFLEWSVDREAYDADPERVARDPRSWAVANPGLGIRVSPEFVAREQRSTQAKSFAVERLSIGDWPSEAGADRVIDGDAWAACAQESSAAEDPVAFAVEVAQDRSSAAIGMAGRRGDGLIHVEPVDVRRNVGWVVDRVVALVERWKPCAVIVDGRSAAASLVPSLEDAGVIVTTTSASDMAQACGSFYDAVIEGRLRHVNDRELNDAVDGATKRNLGDAWAWDRKNPLVNIAPLVAVTLAAHGLSLYGDRDEGPNLW